MLPLIEQFGPIDIYLFDQLLRGRITPGMRILDAGCGVGRNLTYFLREGFEVFGADIDGEALASARSLARMFAPQLPAGNFRLEPVETMSFPAGFADFIISSAVLHFARDDAQFQAMLQGTWRMLKEGGILFCRLTSSIGIESHSINGGRWSALPDGTERYLVDEALLLDCTEALGGEMLDPLRSTIVQNQRSMTTWILRKRPSFSTS